jgi:glycosyl transferase family 25
METFVINLKRSVKRRQLMKRQLDRMGIPYRFFEATDGRELSEDERQRLCVDASEMHNDLSAGQIGCAFSHYRIYKTMIEEGIETAFVLEDDVHLAPELPQILEGIDKTIGDDELVLVFFVPGAGIQLTTMDAHPLVGKYRLLYPLNVTNVMSGVAYVLKLPVARELAKAVYPIRTAVDHWPLWYEKGAFRSMRCVVPSPIRLSLDLPSDIGLGQSTNPVVRQVVDFVTEKNVFPFNKLLEWNRVRVMQEMQKTLKITNEKSPLAPGTGIVS